MIQSVIARLKSRKPSRDAPEGSPLARYLEFVDSQTWPVSRVHCAGEAWKTRDIRSWVSQTPQGLAAYIDDGTGPRPGTTDATRQILEAHIASTATRVRAARAKDDAWIPSAAELERTKERELARFIATRTSIDYAPTPPPEHCYAEGTMHPKAECERDSETIMSLGYDKPTMISHGPWRVRAKESA